MITPLISHHYPTPLGDMVALFTPRGLSLLEFSRDTKGLDREWRDVERHAGAHAQVDEDRRTRALGEQIDAYFKGKLKAFDVPLDLVGTPFQQSVWRALLTIPYGQTRSYAQQAATIGRPTAVRAVAAANGQNKVSIIVPCHRVIGSSGQLTGYGGGLPRKEWLLALERGETPLFPNDK
ncbi:MAG: methylated-DNA--[protein]-cysteine S-methyltransferase [Pseudomonadota bacterium]|nr:methylated-DNA--[protein]-cysteine S-methyltransferase [Pseudomonadota bacterium]